MKSCRGESQELSCRCSASIYSETTGLSAVTDRRRSRDDNACRRCRRCKVIVEAAGHKVPGVAEVVSREKRESVTGERKTGTDRRTDDATVPVS